MHRIQSPDIVRGIAMLLVVEWHAIGWHFIWTDTWAMPVFFFIMGMFFKPMGSLIEMIKKKSRMLLVPFFLLSLPDYLLLLFSSPNVFIRDFLNPFKCVHMVGWFLLAMFWAYLIFFLIVRNCKRRWLRIMISFGSSFSFWYLATFHAFGYRLFAPWFLTTSFVCIALVDAGFELKTVILKSHKHPVSTIFALFMAILGIFLVDNNLIDSMGGGRFDKFQGG